MHSPLAIMSFWKVTGRKKSLYSGAEPRPDQRASRRQTTGCLCLPWLRGGDAVLGGDLACARRRAVSLPLPQRPTPTSSSIYCEEGIRTTSCDPSRTFAGPGRLPGELISSPVSPRASGSMSRPTTHLVASTALIAPWLASMAMPCPPPSTTSFSGRRTRPIPEA
jgi:hypothetical protein